MSYLNPKHTSVSPNNVNVSLLASQKNAVETDYKPQHPMLAFKGPKPPVRVDHLDEYISDDYIIVHPYVEQGLISGFGHWAANKARNAKDWAKSAVGNAASAARERVGNAIRGAGLAMRRAPGRAMSRIGRFAGRTSEKLLVGAVRHSVRGVFHAGHGLIKLKRGLVAGAKRAKEIVKEEREKAREQHAESGGGDESGGESDGGDGNSDDKKEE